jgi:hypothetical protein
MSEVVSQAGDDVPLYVSPRLTPLGGPRRKNNYEPLLLENEREAVADLLQYLESKPLLVQQARSATGPTLI